MSYRVITGYLKTQDKNIHKNKSLEIMEFFFEIEDGGKVKEASAPSLIRCL